MLLVIGMGLTLNSINTTKTIAQLILLRLVGCVLARCYQMKLKVNNLHLNVADRSKKALVPC